MPKAQARGQQPAPRLIPLGSSRRDLIDEDKTTVVKIDVTHPSPGSAANALSIAAMIASVDRWLGQWPAMLRIQSKARKEMVSDLSKMLKSYLRLWKDRDTASTPTCPRTSSSTVTASPRASTRLCWTLLHRACQENPPADQKKGLPRLTFVVVGKRHHTRFYASREGDADRSSNPKLGTVVDGGVTDSSLCESVAIGHEDG
ncbi:ribonuclease H-like domain-containing protein [Coniochaeta sp. 2T2.1]|nr:ribonuclease H-like domain-containing protein [Coniochaeta sp. 2T2.1]